MSVIILDGTALAARRSDRIRSGAADIVQRRGRPPVLLLAAFADANGRVPHIERKLRDARAVGIDTILQAFATGCNTREAVAALGAAVAEHEPDAVFVQFPFPASLDGDAIAAAIPPHLDVDVMSPARIARYLASAGELPPVTVTAATLLLDAHGVEVAGRRGAIIAAESPFARMFREELARRGVDAENLIDPADGGLHEHISRADLVVAAAGYPGLLSSDALSAGTIALDIGYFNDGGRGDIDVGRIDHLDAIMPVPGGVGPMTVSALLERVVEFAHRREPAVGGIGGGT